MIQEKNDRQIGKSIFIVLTMLFTVTVAVMGWHWADTSDKPFWSDFWHVAAIGALLACVIGWVVLNSRTKGKK